jgi:predicted nucleotidyltransferase component of viral defense system
VRDVNLRWLRRQIITALAADDELFELLILKGGNALALVHEIGLRASVDIDYSMEADAKDPAELGRKIFAALRDRLDRQGFVVFDERFTPRPTRPSDKFNNRWGGYKAEFKLATKELWDEVSGDIEKLRTRALPVSYGMQSERKFRIEISKFEYCEDREEKVLEDSFSCQVYTPSLIAAEKLRSICQQMEEYGHRAHPAPRARDFYDLHALLTEGRVKLSETRLHELVRAVFETKSVPLRLLQLVPTYRDFHEAEWDTVLNAIPAGRPRDYGFYFEFVVDQIRKLEPLWVEDSP